MLHRLKADKLAAPFTEPTSWHKVAQGSVKRTLSLPKLPTGRRIAVHFAAQDIPLSLATVTGYNTAPPSAGEFGAPGRLLTRVR